MFVVFYHERRAEAADEDTPGAGGSASMAGHSDQL